MRDALAGIHTCLPLEGLGFPSRHLFSRFFTICPTLLLSTTPSHVKMSYLHGI